MKPQPDRNDGFEAAGATSLADFRKQFQDLYRSQPFRAVKLFFYYLSSRGVDATSRAMAHWATSGTLYISMLLDSDLKHEDTLTPEMVNRAMAVLPQVDREFLIKFSRCLNELTEPAAIIRALHLAPALSDASILVPWLRTLADHKDLKVRSSSAKLLCQIRPNKGLIQRHLQSRDARVRAGVMEALWDAKFMRADQDVLALLRIAVDDPNHRVVANALVGLHRLGEDQAVEKMIALCDTKQQLVRAAMAWALGAVDDARVIPVLQRLALDPSFTVRQRARNSLKGLGFPKTNENGSVPSGAVILHEGR